MSKYLVTGGTGFIGSHIANRLTELGHEVTIIGNIAENSPQVAQFINFNELNDSHLGQFDAVFHQGANNDTLDFRESEMINANAIMSMWLFFNLAKNGCRKFIYASSTAIYGNSTAPYVEDFTPISPLNPYGKSKYILEKLAKQFSDLLGVSTIGLRYCNVYGPGESHKGKRASMILQISKKIMNNQSPALFKNGEQQRDWIHVNDVVEANLKALNYQGSEVFNCGGGKSISFNQLVKLVNRKLNVEIQPIWIDNPHSDNYQNLTRCDMSKAESELGFKPKITIEQGISDYIDWLKEKDRAE